VTVPRLAAQRCLTPRCARMTIRDADDDPRAVCPHCHGPVGPVELHRPARPTTTPTRGAS
jgi:hypothetical protein